MSQATATKGKTMTRDAEINKTLIACPHCGRAPADADGHACDYCRGYAHRPTPPNASTMSTTHPTTGQKMPEYTHIVQYQQRDGSWKDGYLAGTKRETQEVAKIAAARTGRRTRSVSIAGLST